MLRREQHLLTGLNPNDKRATGLAERARLVRQRPQEAETELRRQRTITLDLGAPGTLDNTPIDDPQILAGVWLGRYTAAERTALTARFARDAGVSPAAITQVRTRSGRVERARWPAAC